MVDSINNFNTYNVRDGLQQNLTASFSEKLKNKFPGKIPVIITLDKHMSDYELTRSKFLVDSNVTVSSFQYTLRKYIKNKKSVTTKLIDPAISIFVFYGNPAQNLPKALDTLGDVYNGHSSNGFLFATVLRESTFGAT
jgi:hypothetical protein